MMRTNNIIDDERRDIPLLLEVFAVISAVAFVCALLEMMS